MRRPIVALVILAAACGDGPTSPKAPPPSAPHFAAGTTISLVSADTERPVAGATAVLAGMSSTGEFQESYVTDAAGTFALDRAVLQSPMPRLEVTSAEFLPRRTFLRAGEDNLFPLWPKASPTGLDETFTTSIVYTVASCPALLHASGTLQRHSPSTTDVTLALEGPLQAAAHRQRHEQAVESLNLAIGGAVRYSVALTEPADGIVFRARINPGDVRCTGGGVAAYVLRFVDAIGDEFYIAGGELTYCAEEYANNFGTILHELGHTFGLRHSLSDDVMSCPYVGRPTAFTPRETLVMRLMRLRRGGNLWPDSDPEYIRIPDTASTSAAAGPRSEVILCPG